MDFPFFLLTLLHVVLGMLFCGLPGVLLAEIWFVASTSPGTAELDDNPTTGQASDGHWNLVCENLQQALAFGVGGLAAGVMMGGIQWDDSFARTWTLLTSRWVFLFIEFAFSAALIWSVPQFFPRPKQSIRAKLGVSLILLIAATNLLYHFPSLMVISRWVRLHPLAISDASEFRDLLFSPALFWKWLHVAIACLFAASVWVRIWIAHQTQTLTRLSANGDPAQRFSANSGLDRFDARMRFLLLLTLVGQWASGLLLLINLSPMDSLMVTQLGQPKAHLLILGVVAATAVGLRSAGESRPPVFAWRVFDFVMVLVTIGAMVQAVRR